MCDVKITMSGVDGEYGIPPGVKMGCFTVGSYDVDAHCLLYGALGLICYLMR